jgi:serine/threonine-protein kinase
MRFFPDWARQCKIPEIPLELRTGSRIDRYELVAPIATGGMGSVWLARVRKSAEFERFFAIKTVLPQYAADPSFRKMFLDETRIASAISHANVASILDVGDVNGTLYMVMEWVEGDSLHALATTLEAEQEKVAIPIALRIMADACAGLHAVHEARDRGGKPLDIVHRDLSPHNILISTHGQAKLVDFGVARARDRLADTTSSGTLKGKVRYMSPEYAAGEAIDRRSDLWGIGAVLYRLLEGRCPLEAENNYAILRMLLQRTSPDPMSPAIPTPLEAVVMRCLEIDQDKRFPSAAEVQRAIERVMMELGMTATTADVAAYVEEHLGEASERRRATIEKTLEELDAAPEGEPVETPGPLSDPRGAGSSLSLVSVGPIPVAGPPQSVRDVTVLLEKSPKALARRRARNLRWAAGAAVVTASLVVAGTFASRVTPGGSPPAPDPVVQAARANAANEAVAAPSAPSTASIPPVPPPTAAAPTPVVDAAAPPAPPPAPSAKNARRTSVPAQPASATPRPRVSSAPSDVFDDRR